MTIVLTILFWSRIPEEIPSHYNASGIADQYSDKVILIVILFVVAILMGIMSIAVYCVKQEMISKHAKETEKSQANDIYVLLIFMNFAIQGMFAYITFCSASGRALGSLFLPIMILIVLGPIAVYTIHKVVFGRKNHSETELLAQMETQEEGIPYRSKVDWWLGLLFGIISPVRKKEFMKRLEECGASDGRDSGGRDGYATTFTITAMESCKRWEFDIENSNIKGHWTGLFLSLS